MQPREVLSRARFRVRHAVRPRVTVTAPPPGVRVERDVEVPARDGVVLRVDVFRPATGGPHPVILCAHPYGKDATPRPRRGGGWHPPFQVRLMPQSAPYSISAWTGWEAPDPAVWVARGYAVVNADLRGWGRSDGVGVLLSAAEGDDIHDLVEWAGTRSWSTGRVGLLGVSYLAITQWGAAATRPPHLAAIVPWEGFTDAYRDFLRPGGIREDGFAVIWNAGLRRLHRSPVDLRAQQKARPCYDDWWAARVRDLGAIDVPALVCGSFSDHNLHSVGSFRGFEQIGSSQAWLYTHRGPKWATFYGRDASAFQARFLDRFLRGGDPDFDATPRVRLEVREDAGTIATVRGESAFPPAATTWLALHLGAAPDATSDPAPDATSDPTSDSRLGAGSDPAVAPGTGHAPGTTSEPASSARPGRARNPTAGSLGLEPAPAGRVAFDARRGEAAFRFRFPADVDVVGPMVLHLALEVVGADDLAIFVGVRKRRNGRVVGFEGSYGFTQALVTCGWLKASHRALDPARSTPTTPVHRHTAEERLRPGEVVPAVIGLAPSASRFRAGDELELAVRGRWFFPRNPLVGQFPAAYERSPRGTAVLHVGGDHDAHLLVPVLGPDGRASSLPGAVLRP